MTGENLAPEGRVGAPGAGYLVRMRIVDVRRAKTEISQLLAGVEAGEDIVIARAGIPVARLVPVRARERTPGRLKGRLHIADDFDAPLPGDLRRPSGLSDA
jgi:prevent-host-death family protein